MGPTYSTIEKPYVVLSVVLVVSLIYFDVFFLAINLSPDHVTEAVILVKGQNANFFFSSLLTTSDGKVCSFRFFPLYS